MIAITDGTNTVYMDWPLEKAAKLFTKGYSSNYDMISFNGYSDLTKKNKAYVFFSLKSVSSIKIIDMEGADNAQR